MRLFFHGLFGLAIGIVGAGLASGIAARSTSSHAAELTPTPRPVGHESRVRVSREQAIAPPEPLLPRYAERVSPGGSLAWALDPDTDGARVELSPSPTFDVTTVRFIDVEGDRFRLPASLTAGVWYWRLRGRAEGILGDRATPTRMMFVTTPDWG